MIKITENKYQADIKILISLIQRTLHNFDSVYGIPRGGVTPALAVATALNVPLVDKANITMSTLVVDDLIDSGSTFKKLCAELEVKPHLAVLYRKLNSPELTPLFAEELSNEWVEFFYETTQTDAEENIRRVLEWLGEDPTREGLRETPKRYLKFLKEFTSPAEFNFTTFDSESYSQMIIQKDIPFFSLCEHHMAPFFGYASVAYIPNKRIVGLSKLARTVEKHARRLQNQERITEGIAAELVDRLDPLGVAVQLRARHFCMEMRGVRTHDVHTITTALKGAYHTEPEARSEFLDALK